MNIIPQRETTHVRCLHSIHLCTCAQWYFCVVLLVCYGFYVQHTVWISYMCVGTVILKYVYIPVLETGIKYSEKDTMTSQHLEVYFGLHCHVRI